MRKSLKLLIIFLCCICLLGCGAKEGSGETKGNAEEHSQSVEENDAQDKIVETDIEAELKEETENTVETEVQSSEEVETEPEEPAEEKVHLMTQKKEYRGGELQSEEYYEYDDHGNRTVYKSTNYGYEGFSWTSTETNEYTYDEQGRIVKQILMTIGVDIFTNEPMVTSGWEYTYEYDEHGSEISYCEKLYIPYEDSWVVNYSEKKVLEYNGRGQVIKDSSIREDGTARSWTEWIYNEAGEVTKETEYDDDGSVSLWSEWEYNEKGVLIKETNYNGDGTVRSYTLFDNEGRVKEDVVILSYNTEDIVYMHDLVNNEYDDKGNCIKETWINHNLETNVKSVTEVYIREYDSFGNMVKEERYSKGDTLIEWHEYQYDSNGNMIKDQFYDVANSSHNGRCEYQYDEAGNKIKEEYYSAEGTLASYTEYEYVEYEKSASN